MARPPAPSDSLSLPSLGVSSLDLGRLFPRAGGPSSCVPSNIGKWITRFAKTRPPKPSAFERDGPTRRGENRGTLIFRLEFHQLKALLKSGIGGTIFIIGYLLFASWQTTSKPDPSGNPNSRSKEDGTTLAI